MKPTIADNKPQKVSLEKDTNYSFCACGKSNKQPFCDGSHKGTGMSSMRFTVDKDQDAWLCNCKNTNNPPFCDGSHKGLTDELKGQESP